MNELFVLGDRIRAKITTSYETLYRDLFILPFDEELKKDPYSLLRIHIHSFEVTYIICKKSLYIVVWITSEENVVYVFKSDVSPSLSKGVSPSSSKGQKVGDSNERFKRSRLPLSKCQYFSFLSPR